MSDFIFVVPGSVLIPRLRGEILRFDLNWLYLAMALLMALFGFRRIALFGVKTYDLVLIGWITAMTIRVHAISSLEMLSLGALFAVQVLL